MSTILIIDDASETSDILRGFLEKRGQTVLTAADGANGVLLFRSQRPDLILLGIHVRHDKGWEIIDHIRALDAGARIIVLGSLGTEDARKKADSYGCVGFISKDLGPENFMEEFKRIVLPHLPSAAGAGRAKGRILVVDDESVIREVLGRFLRSKGFQVFTAVNGLEAIDLIKKERPHLMLLDMRMPELDGIGVLRKVHDIDKEIAIMMITANNDLDLARRTMEMGACDYIVKPFNLEYLETTVLAKLLTLTS